MLSFISFWRAAAIVLNDLGSSAFYAGAIAEQDFLRVRLEHQRLKISANLAAIEANQTGSATLGNRLNSTPNEIFANGIGIHLSSAGVIGQHIWGNATGVTGSGSFGDSATQIGNQISNNLVGVGQF